MSITDTHCTNAPFENKTAIKDMADGNGGYFLDGDWIESADMSSEGIRVIQTGNIGIGVFHDKPNRRRFISDVTFKRLSCKKVYPDDLLICRLADPIGRACAAPSSEDYYVTSVDVVIFRPNESFDSKFLQHQINNPTTLRQIASGAGGTTRQRISRTALGNVKLSHPETIQEQSKIAEVLSTCDEAIEQTEAIIAKYERIKQGLMLDLLTKGIDENGNIRSEKTHKFKDSQLGRIPVEWDTIPIGELSKHVGSGITPRGGFSVYTSEGVLFLRSQNIHFGGLRLDDVAHIPDRIHRRMKRSAVVEHDVLLNITGASIGRCTVVPTDLGIANVNQHVCAIRLTNTSKQNSVFLATFIESWMGQQQIDRLNAGSNREGLNYEQVKAIRTMWPPEPERKLISQRISTTIRTIVSEKRCLLKLQRIKRGLMQDLLSGDVRVTPLMQKV